jgi:hypothetical protein
MAGRRCARITHSRRPAMNERYSTRGQPTASLINSFAADQGPNKQVKRAVAMLASVGRYVLNRPVR